MSFVSQDLNASEHKLRVHDDGILYATTVSPEGELINSQMDLNTVIGNAAGEFTWDSVNFSQTAQGIDLSTDGTKLIAELQDGNGEYTNEVQGIELNERICIVERQLMMRSG